MASKDGTVMGEIRAAIDQEKLIPYLEANIDGYKGPLTIKQFGFGQSNPTYFLETPSRAYVLRRAPLGKLMSKTAHRVDREYLILEAIGKFNLTLPDDAADRRVPVPAVYCLCMDPAVAGAPFYVMEFIKGRIFTDVRLPQLEEKDRYECWRSAIKTLTLLSTVPVEALKLPASFAPNPLTKPYFPRQVNSMLKVSAVQAATPSPNLSGGTIGPIYGQKELLPYFESGAKNAGGEELHGASVVHGDYKMDNVIFHPTENRVIGILDWELCTVGSPLADLGNMLMPFSILPVNPKDHANVGSSNLVLGLKDLPSSETGIPQVSELEQAWALGMNGGLLFHSIASGGQQHREPWVWPIPHMEWVRSWMLFRLAIISQGIAARAALGQASSAGAKPTRDASDFFGKMSYDVMRSGEERGGAAKL